MVQKVEPGQTALSTNIADGLGIISLVDSNAAAFPSRFYRAYSP